MTGPAPPRSAPALRLFERSRPKAIDMPGVSDFFRKFARECAGIVRELAEIDVDVELEALEQIGAGLPKSGQSGTLDLVCFVPECSAHALVRLDSILLFRSLDAMFGGSPRLRSSVPDRALTPLERSVALALGRGVLERLLPELGLPGPGKVQMAEEIEPQSTPRAESETIVARLRLVELADRIVVAIPATALDRLSRKLAQSQQAEPRTPDPTWTDDLKRNVGAVRLPVVATIECPRMPLGAVAGLQPGSLIEFSGEAMRGVTLTSSRQPVFTGRLGQSRGMYTVLLERPARAQADAEGEA